MHNVWEFDQSLRGRTCRTKKFLAKWPCFSYFGSYRTIPKDFEQCYIIKILTLPKTYKVRVQNSKQLAKNQALETSGDL